MPGIADAVGGGRVRLDAIARWLQDVAYADLLDAGFDEQRGLDRAPAAAAGRAHSRASASRSPCAPSAAASGASRPSDGRRSAGRRLGRRGRALDLDRRAAGARRASRSASPISTARARASRGATVAPAPSRAAGGARAGAWMFRAADVDVAGHVNNSHYWALLEERLAAPSRSDRRRDRAPRAGAARGRLDRRRSLAGALDRGRRRRRARLDPGRLSARPEWRGSSSGRALTIGEQGSPA